MNTRTRSDWSALFKEAALLNLEKTPCMRRWGLPELELFVMSFRDDSGNRRDVDEPFLRHLLEAPLAIPGKRGGPDASLWWGVQAMPLRENPPALEAISSGQGATGPLVEPLRQFGVEVWHEGELCALHALSWLTRGRDELGMRVRSAAAWMMDEVQPDNATNRPWAIHVFAGLATEGDSQADLYAQTLFHNAIVGRERPDVLSAMILLDAAGWLERAAESVLG
ncbi:MAG: hypothetical protein JSR77_09990 [Planctomycetes bacterium]|nr:hypothetical protein [Planctomycetota bacterium]